MTDVDGNVSRLFACPRGFSFLRTSKYKLYSVVWERESVNLNFSMCPQVEGDPCSDAVESESRSAVNQSWKEGRACQRSR